MRCNLVESFFFLMASCENELTHKQQQSKVEHLWRLRLGAFSFGVDCDLARVVLRS
jgi:uncharacterized protein YoaH (UPF0181 family)